MSPIRYFRSSVHLFYKYLSSAYYYMHGIILEIVFTTLNKTLNEGFLEDSSEFGRKKGWGRFGEKIKEQD